VESSYSNILYFQSTVGSSIEIVIGVIAATETCFLYSPKHLSGALAGM